jgi:peptide/nickel transport system substrate-binding protein
MSKASRRFVIAVGVIGLSLCMAATARAATRGEGSAVSSRTAEVAGGTATLIVGAFQSLDPQVGFLTTNSEAEYVVYTPLLTFAHKNGVAGTDLIPGLASALPQVTNHGLTYTLTLRKGLRYADGTAAKASDFVHVVERALKLNWGGDSFLTADIVGAADFQAGKANSVAGIAANDKTGKIVIRLIQGDSAFSNILAFTGLGLIPGSTPITDQGANPPPGIGAYKIANVVPGQGFDLVKNTTFSKLHLPGIPTGYLSKITVSVVTNSLTAGEQVLNNQADAFDPSGVIQPALIDPIKSQAADRFRAEPSPAVQYLFFNTSIAPFNNKAARVAVTYAFDRNAVQRLESGFLQPGCYILPVSFPGHPTKACPYGKPTAAPNIAKAKAMIEQAHLDGTAVTAYAQAADPYQEIGAYYVSVLNQIGFKASLKLLAASIYYPTTANPQLGIQTGYASYRADYSNPTTFYHLLDARTITPTFSVNRDQLNDAHLQSILLKLQPQPLSAAVNKQWSDLDVYSAQQAFWFVIGYTKSPEFFSNRIDIKKAIFSQRYLADLSSWQLKK